MSLLFNKLRVRYWVPLIYLLIFGILYFGTKTSLDECGAVILICFGWFSSLLLLITLPTLGLLTTNAEPNWILILGINLFLWFILGLLIEMAFSKPKKKSRLNK